MGEVRSGEARDYQSSASEASSATEAAELSIWPQESLDCERRFGRRVARLYPFLHDPKRKTNIGAVKVGERIGTLHQAFSTGCLVELMGERKFVGNQEKRGPIMRQFAVEEVVPGIPQARLNNGRSG